MCGQGILTTIFAAYIHCNCLLNVYSYVCVMCDTYVHTLVHTHTDTHTHSPTPFIPSAVVVPCSTMSCNCPAQPFPCPRDSVLVERRISSCCVQYECVCPHAACPVLAECDSGVQPVPMQRGHGYPGFCCPQYRFEGVYTLVHCSHMHVCR